MDISLLETVLKYRGIHFRRIQGNINCRCGGPRFDQSRIRLNAYRVCARMRSDRFYLF